MIPRGVIDAARAERFSASPIRIQDPRRAPLELDGVVVGFVTPHQAADGRWRLGPFYVLPESRGRGLVAAVYEAMRDRDMMACVLDTNEASRRVHERAGFVRWKRFVRGWYLRRDAVM